MYPLKASVRPFPVVLVLSPWEEPFQRAGNPSLPCSGQLGTREKRAGASWACCAGTLLGCDGLSPPTEKLKDAGLQAPKPVQHPLHPAPTPHHAVPSLLSNHSLFSLPSSSAATALLIQRTNEEEKWLARQRRLRQEKEDRQSQVSEFRQQVLEQHLDMGRPPVPTEPEHRPESARWGPPGRGVWEGTRHTQIGS